MRIGVGTGARADHDVGRLVLRRQRRDLRRKSLPQLDAGPSRNGDFRRAPMRFDRATGQIVRDRLAPLWGHQHHAALDRDQTLGEPDFVRDRQFPIERALVGPQAQHMDQRDADQRHQHGACGDGIEGADHRRSTAGTNI